MFEHPRTRGGRNQAGRAARIAVRPRDRVGAGLACIVRAPIFLCSRPRCEADGTIVARRAAWWLRCSEGSARRCVRRQRPPSGTAPAKSGAAPPRLRESRMSAHVGPSRTAWLLWRWLGICGAAITRCTVHRRHFSTDVHGTARAGGFLSDSVVRHGTAWAVPIWARALSRRRHQSHECWELDWTPAWEERFARAREPSLAANPIIDILVARASQDESPADRGALQTAQQERVQRRPQFLADRVPEGSRCRKRREREAGVGGGSQSKAVLRRLLT